MNERGVNEAIRAALAAPAAREVRAGRVADLIRRVGGYRWVGLYEVHGEEIAVVGWSGLGAPAHPRFPRDRGLNGAAVAAATAVVVGDVAADSRDVTTLGGTRSEMIVPVIEPNTGMVIGTIDVASERPHAFSATERQFVERCAAVASIAWLP